MDLCECRKLGTAIDRHLRLTTFPLAVKFYASGEEIPDGVKRVERGMTHCQSMNVCRRYGYSLYMEYDDFVPYCYAPFIYGFLKVMDADDFDRIADSGVMYACSSREVAIRTLRTIPFMEYEKYCSVACSPLEWTKIEPQFVVLYGNPAQMLRAIQGLSRRRSKGAFFESIFAYGWSVCAYGIARSLSTGEPQFFLPDYGERRFGLVADDEMGVVIPGGLLADFVAGLEETHAMGARYPIPFYLDFSPTAGMYSPMFDLVEERKALKKRASNAFDQEHKRRRDSE